MLQRNEAQTRDEQMERDGERRRALYIVCVRCLSIYRYLSTYLLTYLPTYELIASCLVIDDGWMAGWMAFAALCCAASRWLAGWVRKHVIEVRPYVGTCVRYYVAAWCLGG